jgi:hypothetical protein
MRKLILAASAVGLAFALAPASAQQRGPGGPPPLPQLSPEETARLSVVPPVTSKYAPKKLSWGEPDFQGSWPIDHLAGLSLQRDARYGNRAFLSDGEYAQRVQAVVERGDAAAKETANNKLGMGNWAERGGASRQTSLLVSPANGRLPEFTPQGKELSGKMRSTWRQGQTFDWVTDFDSWDACITRGMPASMFPFQYNNGMRIFQAPGLVAIQMEMIHETRIIPTNGAAPIPAKLQNWIGESRGRWEGNVLLVETTNFKPGPSATNIGTSGSPSFNDTPVTTSAKMTERFTMTGPDSIVYEVTWNDPVVFTAPWTARLDWRRNNDFGIFEYACHEGDIQIRNYITASRAQRAAAAAAPK